MPLRLRPTFRLPRLCPVHARFRYGDVAAGNEVLVELRRLAEQGDAMAQLKLGIKYEGGWGVRKTMPKP